MISIITPHIGPVNLLKECIESIKRCTTADYEIIGVIDKPDEVTSAYLTSVKNMKVIINDNFIGAEAAINKGFQAATGSYLCYLMTDIELYPGAIELLKNALEKQKEFGWVALSSEHTGFLAGCSMITREAFEKVGLWCEEYLSGGGFSDDDYLRRMWKVGYKPHIVAGVKVKHKVSSKALSEKERGERFAQNQALFHKKWGEMGTNWDTLPRYDSQEQKSTMVKLNLGSFKDTISYGWTNIDILNIKQFIPADHIFKQWDLRRGIPYTDSSVDLIRCSHLIEHLTLEEANNLLKEFYRTLKPDGLARIATPDLDIIVKHYYSRDMSFFNAVEQPAEYIQAPTVGERFSRLLFSGDYQHRAIYSFDMLKTFLEQAGFAPNRIFRGVPRFSHAEQMQMETQDQHESISFFCEVVR